MWTHAPSSKLSRATAPAYSRFPATQARASTYQRPCRSHHNLCWITTRRKNWDLGVWSFKNSFFKKNNNLSIIELRCSITSSSRLPHCKPFCRRIKSLIKSLNWWSSRVKLVKGLHRNTSHRSRQAQPLAWAFQSIKNWLLTITRQFSRRESLVKLVLRLNRGQTVTIAFKLVKVYCTAIAAIMSTLVIKICLTVPATWIRISSRALAISYRLSPNPFSRKDQAQVCNDSFPNR